MTKFLKNIAVNKAKLEFSARYHRQLDPNTVLSLCLLISHSYFHLSKCFIRNYVGSGSLHNGTTGHMHVFRIDSFAKHLFTCLKQDPIILQSQELHIYIMVSDSDYN